MLENLDNRSEEFCLMGNFLVSEGKPGKVHAYYMSSSMRFPAMWYVGPAKSQISLHISSV